MVQWVEYSKGDFFLFLRKNQKLNFLEKSFGGGAGYSEVGRRFGCVGGSLLSSVTSGGGLCVGAGGMLRARSRVRCGRPTFRRPRYAERRGHNHLVVSQGDFYSPLHFYHPSTLKTTKN